ncbi:uncharacterized protein LOC109605337 [Aethina tumida]|uniref:uncharacterized protein LOC109605337 n=1 Tax=Aethina tumida TaxID=116153 RepID=UPI00096B291A|nr:uncharacterized protein LOC109605337 [Aethina tumida]
MALNTLQFMVILVGLAALASAKPIMVTFGTKQGPIVPRQKSTAFQPRNLAARSPAPVSEEREDVPNPQTYTPLVPHQYRTKLLSVKVPSNLILGTPLDQKFTPSLQKYNIQKKQAQGRSLGPDYTGPHIFERQDYEFLDAPQKTTLQPSFRYDRPHYYQQIENNYNLQQDNQRYVPQIGIVYSGGVRYYVPQLIPQQQREQQIQEQKEQNSVYDHSNEKVTY